MRYRRKPPRGGFRHLRAKDAPAWPAANIGIVAPSIKCIVWDGVQVSMPFKRLTRRDVLKIGAAAGAANLGATLLSGCGLGNAIASTVQAVTGCAKVTDIDHVVIFIQENRSFDHYFGSYRGVRGLDRKSTRLNSSHANISYAVFC